MTHPAEENSNECVIEIIRGAGMFIAAAIGAAALFAIVRVIAKSGSFLLNIGFITIVSAGVVLLLQKIGIQNDGLMRLVGVLFVILFVIAIRGTYKRKLEKQTELRGASNE